MECTIYFIRCLSNGKMYVGSCLNYNSRISNHFKDLMKAKHSNKLLQADFNYYGRSNFEYGQLETCNEEDALDRENENMDKYKTYIPEYGTDFGYNLSRASRKNPSDILIRDTSNYSKAQTGNRNSSKLTLEQCKEVKKLLLEQTDELIKDKLKRIADIFNVSPATIGSIRDGKHWSCEYI